MLDIMLSVCMCAKFQSASKDYHLRVVKRIMRYLVLTHNLGLWYPKGSHFEVIGYSDADYAGCKVDRKSTSGTYQFLGRSFVLQRNKILFPIHDRNPSISRRFDSPSPQDLQILSGSLSPKVFLRFSFNFFDLLLNFINARSLYLGAPLGCRYLALNLV
jgi:hypothetical protein